MTEYLEEIVDTFDPIEHLTGRVKELAQVYGISAIPYTVSEPKEVGTKVGKILLTQNILWHLLELSSSLEKSTGEIEERGDPFTRWNPDQRADLDLFFVFAGQVQEHLLKEAYFNHFISEEARNESVREQIFNPHNGMSAAECRKYLNKAGIIDDGLNSNIHQTRTTRHETVHDISRWFNANPSPEDIRASISRAERSTVRLLEIAHSLDLES